MLIVLNLRNGLGLANVEANTQTGVIGVILIVSVLARNAIDSLRRRWDRCCPGRPATSTSPPRRSARPDDLAAPSDARS